VVLCTTMQKEDKTSCVKLCSISKRCRDGTYIDNTRKLQNHKIIFYCLQCKDAAMRLVTGEIKFREIVEAANREAESGAHCMQLPQVCASGLHNETSEQVIA
jgi:hypothetical protein